MNEKENLDGNSVIHQFKHRTVRDLAWAIASPPLVSGSFNQTHWWNSADCKQELKSCLPALLALDNNPQALRDHLSQIKSKRLGLYFEGLISFWLSDISPNFQLIAQNIQLFANQDQNKKGKQTLGEIDFIIKQLATQKIIHLEVAVKFYLGTEPLEDAYRWFGTNTEDQLGKKVDHLKQHQTQLSLKHPKLLKHQIDERHCLLKGRLFYPENSKKVKPNMVLNDHLQGRWYDFNALQKQHHEILFLPKTDWLAPLNPQDIIERKQSLDYAKENIDNNRPNCFCLIKKDASGKFTEIERIFYLPEQFIFPTKNP